MNIKSETLFEPWMNGYLIINLSFILKSEACTWTLDLQKKCIYKK